MNEKNKVKWNIVVSLLSQAIIIILGLVIPRIVLTNYGSDTNGMTGTVSQIFTYLALLECGISQAARNALYSPVNNNDKTAISRVVSTARNYYRRIAVYYFIIVVVLALLMPMILKTEIPFLTVVFYILFEGLTNVVAFYFVNAWNCILFASGENYIVNLITLFTRILTYTVKIVLVSMQVNIAVIQIGYFIISLIQLAVYYVYMKKNYAWLDYNASSKNEKLPDRNAYIITEVAWTVFSATDMIVLSVMASTKLSSVYGIYSMIFSNISLLLNSVYSSVCYLLGQTFHKDKEKYKLLHDAFNSTFVGIITILMSVCYILTIPFVSIYTKGVNDINYIYPILPLMFCFVNLLSWSRYVSGNLTGIAGYAKSVSYISLFEALINLILSIFLVGKFGIIGVLEATVIALPIKVIWCTYITERKVLQRSPMHTISIIGCNYIFYFCVVFFSQFWKPEISNMFQLVFWGFVLTVVITVINTLVNCVVNRTFFRTMLDYFIRKRG